MGPRHVLAWLVMLAPTVASADKGGSFVSAGLVLGAGMHEAGDNGFLFGAELSAGHFALGKGKRLLDLTPHWIGGYVDVVRDFGADATRITFGPEIGTAMIGIDGGLSCEVRDGRWGWTIRPVLTVGALAVFVRYTGWASGDERSDVQVGALVKLPVPMF